uniref:DUF4218 domain-containing protein n=1 Tax=Tanacetum cinerariifolium TaxID=118510 RepID=A0A6L2MLT2_TANCI|nr:hypothetical protein [Tanacetum cinerariifolium]
MMCVDNTKWMLQEQNRFSFQIDVFHKLYADKIKSNPKNLVGVSTLAGEIDGGTKCILADPSYNHCKHMSCMHVYVDGPLDLKNGLQLVEITSRTYLTSNDLLLRLVVFARGPLKDDNTTRKSRTGDEIFPDDICRPENVTKRQNLSTLHFLKFLENSFEVLKLLENSVEVLKILENKLESMKILENKLEPLKLQENQPVDGLVPLFIKKFTFESVFERKCLREAVKDTTVAETELGERAETEAVDSSRSLTERSSEGQPAHTASGEDGTTGKDRMAKTPQAYNSHILNLTKFIDDCKPLVNSVGNVKCPCKSCRTVLWVSIENLPKHIMRYGWDPGYKTCVHHDEPNLSPPPPVIDNTSQLKEILVRQVMNRLKLNVYEFEELYVSANEELYLGCDYVTRLDFMAKFTSFKVKGKLTESIFNEMLKFFQHVFPTVKGYKLPPSYYAINKTFKTIRLGYESIHACVNDCFLFRGDNNKDVHLCPVYKTSKWKDSNTPRKKVPKKPGKMQHPVDGQAWKNFDTKYHNFAKEPRNVRLGLAADGFNPFGNLSQAYSMWPVILITHNLPPWLRIETIDVATGQKFNTRAMVLWTISDFLALEALEGEPICTWWMFPFERFIRKLKGYVRNKAKAKGSIAEGYVAKEALTFSSHYFRDVTTKFNRLDRNVDPLPQRVIFSKFPNKDMKEEFLDWFGPHIRQHHVDNDPGVSATNELFALACGPTPTPISVNFCVVNGVRFVVHNRDEHRTT